MKAAGPPPSSDGQVKLPRILPVLDAQRPGGGGVGLRRPQRGRQDGAACRRCRPTRGNPHAPLAWMSKSLRPALQPCRAWVSRLATMRWTACCAASVTACSPIARPRKAATTPTETRNSAIAVVTPSRGSGLLRSQAFTFHEIQARPFRTFPVAVDLDQCSPRPKARACHKRCVEGYAQCTALQAPANDVQFSTIATAGAEPSDVEPGEQLKMTFLPQCRTEAFSQ